MASMLLFPEGYYVPGRLRDSYRPRLAAAGLWNVAQDEKVKNEKRMQIKEAFMKDKVNQWIVTITLYSAIIFRLKRKLVWHLTYSRISWVPIRFSSQISQ